MNDRKARRSRPRRRNGFIDVLNGFLTLFIIAVLIGAAGISYVAWQYYGQGPGAEETTFRVEAGSSISSAAERLRDQGLITDPMIFRLVSTRIETGAPIKAGDFRIPAGASMADIYRELTTGNPIRYAVTIPEGWTAWEALQRLNSVGDLVGEISALPAEGSILPGSYDYVPGSTRQSVLDTMQAAMTTAVAEVWAGRRADLPIDTPEEMVVLASIVEKETGVASERPQVAAVFVNRLNESMRLQSDPTIIYGITKGQATLGRGLRRSEIEAETPYNTYQIDGLPPTPIANPGIDALKAVANPDDHQYLYFVAKGATPSEGHVFAESYSEHQQNVARYREAERAAAQQSESDAEAARQALEAEEAGEAVAAEPPATP